MVLLILKYFIHEIAYSRGKCLIIIFTVTVDCGVPMLYACFVAVEWNLFNVLPDVLDKVVRIELKELNEVFLFERADD